MLTRRKADIGRLKVHYDGLSIGAQWEIARLISLGRVDGRKIKITDLQTLRGSNAEFAPKVVQKLLPQALRTSQDSELMEKAFARENAAKVCRCLYYIPTAEALR